MTDDERWRQRYYPEADDPLFHTPLWFKLVIAVGIVIAVWCALLVLL